MRPTNFSTQLFVLIKRSMHRCPPQLDRPSNPGALVPGRSFILCSTAVPRPRATFSHRNRDILSRIARVSCDPFFPSPWRVHWGRASCTTASQSARGKLVKVLYFSHNSVSINSTWLEQNSNVIVTIPTGKKWCRGRQRYALRVREYERYLKLFDSRRPCEFAKFSRHWKKMLRGWRQCARRGRASSSPSTGGWREGERGLGDVGLPEARRRERDAEPQRWPLGNDRTWEGDSERDS